MEGFNISLTNHLNSSTHTDCKYWGPESDAEIIAKRIAFVLVILLGIFGNVFIILLAAKFTVRRNLNYLIINMAVSDTLFLLASLLMYIPWISNYKMRIQSKVFRRSALFLWHTSVRVSIITLLVISIERFRATKQTIQQPYTLKQRMIVLGFCWLVPMLLASFFTYVESHGLETLTTQRKSLSLAIWIHEILVVVLCCVIFALGILTTKRLSRLRPIHSHLNKEQLKARGRRTQAAVRMVLASVLLFACCILPILIFNVLLYVKEFFPSVAIFDVSTCIDGRSIIFIAYKFLLVVNSCFSPLIYIVFLPDFKESARKILFRGRGTQNQASEETQLSCSQLQTVGRAGQTLSQEVQRSHSSK